MKTIKTIETLNERAERKGVAKVNTREPDYYTGWVGGLIEKYRVTNDGEKASLYHYGTLTATVNLKTKEPLYVYGESVSDADSIGTFLRANGVHGFDFGFRPVNGGFYARFLGNEFNYENIQQKQKTVKVGV